MNSPEASSFHEQKHQFVTCTKLRSGSRRFCVYAVEWGGNPTRMLTVNLIEVGTGQIHIRDYNELAKLIENGTMVYD